MTVLASIIILGILAQWIAWKTKVPSILPLILIGLSVGPLSTYFTDNGCKLIQPMFEGSDQCSNFIFPGEYLFYFVSLAIGIILFEGGLTLKRKEIKGVGPVILKLISVGSLITFIGGALGAHYIMDLSWTISFLFSALIIVTGPTVIAPILQNVPLHQNISTILKWEGILIDPIGALVAVLVFDFIISGGGDTFEISSHVLKSFLTIVLIGLALGTIAAFALAQLIKREMIPHFLHNVVTLASVLGVFILSDGLAHESGLLSVVVMGMVMGNMDLPDLREILHFKESLTILLISILFILLSANINIEELKLLLNWKCLILFAIVIFVLRPAGVFWSTHKSDLTFDQKLFVSWVGPRGIVAAGIASLFGLKLMQKGVVGAEYITPLVFMIVLGTVLLNATTARALARLLNVTLDNSNGVLIIGSNRASIIIAKYLHDNGRHVTLIDNNASSIQKAKALGLPAFKGNIYRDGFDQKIELLDTGYVMAMTSNADVNQFACNKLRKNFGEQGAYRLITPEELNTEQDQIPAEGLFSNKDDYINLMEVVRDNPNIHEIDLESKEQFIKCIRKINEKIDSIPLFIKDKEGLLTIIPANHKDLKIESGDKLIYIGIEINLAKIGNNTTS